MKRQRMSIAKSKITAGADFQKVKRIKEMITS